MLLLNSWEVTEITTKNNPYSSTFIFHHLPPTFGTTIGNSLRRFLLDSLSGIAIWGIEIADKNGPVETNFAASWEGIDKSAPWYLIAKLKEIVFAEKKLKEGIFVLEMAIENNTKKERIITAGDLEKTQETGVEIKNPELELVTLSPGGKLTLKLHCQKNCGYHPTTDQKKRTISEDVKEYLEQAENKGKKILLLDANYSPFKGGQVSFKAELVVASLDREEEELTLTITTNGAIEPQKALLEALAIAQNSFYQLAELIQKKKEKPTQPREEK